MLVHVERILIVHRLTDGKAEFDEDESQLDPEREAKDAVLAEVVTKALIFCADEDGGDDVSGADDLVRGRSGLRNAGF